MINGARLHEAIPDDEPLDEDEEIDDDGRFDAWA